MAIIWVVSSFHLAVGSLDLFPWRDKGVHFVEYAVLGFLVAHASLRTWPAHSMLRTGALAIYITVAWGVLDELHQACVPGRSADVLDLVADTAGAVAGTSCRYIASVTLRSPMLSRLRGSS
jgi:VanZ family protein